MKSLLIVTVICSTFLVGCTTTVYLSAQAEKVKFATSEAPSDCKELTFLTTSPANQHFNRIVLRNKTAELGGNYFKLENSTYIQKLDAYEMSGTAFRCPN